MIEDKDFIGHIFPQKSLMFEKEIDKIGYLNENINKTEPILINREGFLCYNCGYKLI